MTSERWKQIETAFEQALDLGTQERSAFLEQACNGDEELRREVESLLDAHAEAGSFIDDRSRFYNEFEPIGPAGLQSIGHYRIVRELGRGGMGAVYLAERSDEYRKRVAIKLIKRGMDTDALLHRFRNERQILAGFDHPNIARLFDGGTTEDGLPYFVMEYIEGLPIDEYCNKQALSIPGRLKLFREVCAAVSYAHRHLVIHRDLKRSNILVTADGVPKLLDFGIAKILQSGDGAPTFATMTGLRLMTPEYASPEQVRGQSVTTATDVYSLGVILYELLTGQFPYRFASQTPRDIEHAITTTQPQKPSTATARSDGNSKLETRNSKFLKGDLDNIVLMALRKEPERRYQSVEQFSEDIRRQLEARPIFARKDTAGYRAGKFVRRNKLALAAAALIFLSLLGGIIATTLEAYRTRQQKALAERRFNDVRKLAHSVLFDYHDAIKSLPGATKVRERLVKDALTYLDSLAAEAHDDSGLQRELAAAYERVGDVRGGQSSGSLGDIAGALESYEKALKIYEALVALNAKDSQARRGLASSHYKIGYRMRDTAQASGGLEHLQKAYALYLDLTREQPANDELQLELANTCGGLAWVLPDADATRLELLRKALAISEKLVAKNPREQRYRYVFLSSQRRLSYELFSRGDSAGAIETGNKACALGEALLAEDPLNADYRRMLVLIYQNAAIYRVESNTGVAIEYFGKAVALDEELLVADSGNALTQKDLALTHKRMADLLDENDAAQALLHYRKALEGYVRVVQDAPADLTSQFLIATCHGGVALEQARLGQLDAAREECRKAVALLQGISDGKGGHLGRAQAYECLGYAYKALAQSAKISASESRQHMSTARDMFRQSLNIIEQARSRAGVSARDNESFAKLIAAELAKCETALGKLK
jgi:tetratricopeptide (TPR) repeat protein